MPMWNGTPYQSWKTIVPFLAEINPDHPFITWLAEQKDDNFGYLVLSHFGFKTVYQHLQSLTQIYPAETTEINSHIAPQKGVFFKFWEPVHSFPIFKTIDEKECSDLMGPCFSLIALTQNIFHPQLPDANWKPFPWFTLSQASNQKISLQQAITTENNLLRLIEDQYQYLQQRLSPKLLKQKIQIYDSLHPNKKKIDLDGLFKFIIHAID